MQTCRTCGDEKPFKDFHKDPTNATGYKKQCKACKPATPYKAFDPLALFVGAKDWEPIYFS